MLIIQMFFLMSRTKTINEKILNMEPIDDHDYINERLKNEKLLLQDKKILKLLMIKIIFLYKQRCILHL